jgi:Protein of unknown function (DUF742)
VANTTHWKVRPYVLTGGRTRTRQNLLVHTLVSVERYDMLFAASLPRDIRSLYEHARHTCSVAELSAVCGMSLGVTRVVLDDLVFGDRVVIHADKYRTSHDPDLLERLRDGLRKFA